ncbi:Cna B-type domain-containing protein, partial [Peptoniphilus sp. HMSC062D09]|uniref:Cna B-type domain-containing protein n=1 Tax=Peptoniphilus sp. HMSC062D09 TaxID=1739305 RepID=UPI001439D2C2
TWDNLDKTDANGNLIVYTVKEAGEENGTIAIGDDTYTVTTSGNATNGFTITNTLKNKVIPEPEKITITARKEWAAGDGATLPDQKPTVTFDLYADGVKLDNESRTIANGQSQVTWNLPKTNDKGTEIVYTLKEAGEENGTIAIGDDTYTVTTSGDMANGFTITNTIKKVVPETVALKASKIWVAGEGATLPSVKPDVTFDLYADNVKLDNESKTLKNGMTSVTWTDLLKTNANNQDIVYTVKEAGGEN